MIMNPTQDPDVPLISVIIPVYNGEKYIEKTISSVLSQTEKRFEIISINDGSTDGSLLLLQNLETRYPEHIVVLTGPNSGVSNARNKGVNAAKGNYIAFIDQDDLWAPGKLKEQVKLHEQDPIQKVTFTNEAIIDEQGKVIRDNVLQLGERHRGHVFEELLFDNFIPLSSVMLPKSLFQQVGGFDPAYDLAEDFDFLLKAAQVASVDYVSAPLLLYREHRESNTYTKIDRITRESFSILSYWKEKRPDLFRKNWFRYRVFKLKFLGLKLKGLMKSLHP